MMRLFPRRPAPVKSTLPQGRVLHIVSQRSVGPCRGEGHPDRTGHPVGQGVPHRSEPSLCKPRRSLIRRLDDLNDRIEGSWVGDLIGVVSIFATLFLGLWLGEMMR
ncbi:MAG: hypothetical protein Q7J57_16545 [Gemmobacter sp.]|nr:hypothetical protein [Gemmobacter sp.]